MSQIEDRLDSIENRLGVMENSLQSINHELGTLGGKLKSSNGMASMVIKYIALPLIIITGALVGVKLFLPL